jgi:serine/threonine protein kinase
VSVSRLDVVTWRRISDCLDVALDRSPQERDQWLMTLSQTDPAVASTVREMLREGAADSSCFAGLENVLPPLAQIVAEKLPEPGMQIGAYTLERPIGSGGMGEVWLATRSDGRFEGHCAIKFLARHVMQPQFASGFRREGRLLACVTHPNIARLIDAGATDTGQHYLVIDYVEGVTIERYCELSRLPVRARVELFLDVTSAVAHAHANLIVHCDLKPANVLVTRDGVVKLLDFGIAKLIESEQLESPSEESPGGGVALTPDYAAPEQLRGETASTVTDVYQLGMLLYVLLAGAHPLRLSGSRSERIDAALTANLPLASSFAPQELRAQLQGDLDAILSKALARDPAERYGTVMALRDDLVRYLSHEPVSVRSGAAWYRFGKFVRRHRVMMSAISVATISLFAGTFFALRQADLASQERDHAQVLQRRSETMARFSGAVILEAATSGGPMTTDQALDRSAEIALANRSGTVEDRAAVLGALAKSYEFIDDIATADQMLERAAAMLANSADRDLRTRLDCQRATVLTQRDNSKEALRLIDAVFHDAPRDPMIRAECLRAQAYAVPGAIEGERLAFEALKQARSSGKLPAEIEADYLASIGRLYFAIAKYPSAMKQYAEALRVLTEAGLDESAVSVKFRANFSVASRWAGAPRQALELSDEAVRISSRGGRPPLPYLLQVRGRALEALGRFDDAEEAFRTVLTMSKQSGRGYGRAQSVAVLGLARLAARRQDAVVVEKYLAEATALSGGNAGVWQEAMIRATLDLGTGRAASALRRLGQPPYQTVEAYLLSSEALRLTGDLVAAEKAARTGLSSYVQIQETLPYSSDVGLAWLELGKVLQAQDSQRAAREAFAQATRHLKKTVDARHPDLIEARRLLTQAAP